MLDYLDSTSRVVVDLQSNSASEGDAKGDIISNFENLRGSAYNDLLTGNGASNSIEGQGGNDRINGRGGDDKINGGAGNDILTGGTGSDTFNFHANAGTDRITGFKLHEDRIDLHVMGLTGSNLSYILTGNDGYAVDIDITLGSAGHVILDNISLADVDLAMQSVHIV
jgi:Ca2+-binding RTX toxin-like protein